MGDRQEQ